MGATILNPSGTLNPGTISVNGQREFANYFSVNGSDVEEDVNAGTAIIPNLDAIAEFRIVTSNFDAEYGEFSGGQISVITKSGTNEFHGNAFDFLRNTDLDARNYFSPTRGAFRQNQFGGTIGGPIRRDKAFFFADYQGTRQTQGIDTGNISVPSNADRTGNLSDLAAQPHRHGQRPLFRKPAHAEAGLQRSSRRAVLCARLRQPGAVCLSQCRHSAERVVDSSAADAAIYPRSRIPPAAPSRLLPITRFFAMTKGQYGSMRIRVGD